VLAVGDARRRILEQRRQTRLALVKRQAGDIFAVQLEEVEGEIGQMTAAAVGGLLHDLKRRHAVRPHAAKLAVYRPSRP
jgi:hypothetical protein